jgi:hypothetical protein
VVTAEAAVVMVAAVEEATAEVVVEAVGAAVVMVAEVAATVVEAVSTAAVAATAIADRAGISAGWLVEIYLFRIPRRAAEGTGELLAAAD